MFLLDGLNNRTIGPVKLPYKLIIVSRRTPRQTQDSVIRNITGDKPTMYIKEDTPLFVNCFVDFTNFMEVDLSWNTKSLHETKFQNREMNQNCLVKNRDALILLDVKNSKVDPNTIKLWRRPITRIEFRREQQWTAGSQQWSWFYIIKYWQLF